MILKRWRKPKWQHANADVRRRALEALGVEEVGIFKEVACNDENPGLRRLALRRVDDLALLEERATVDTDAGVRDQATSRYRLLLAGACDDAPALSERLERVRTLADTALLEYLLRDAKEPEIRELALAHVEREALLGDVAINDPAAAIRSAAVERITKEPTLERVVKHSRNQDKRVRKRAKEKLAALRIERERPGVVEAACTQICSVLANLGTADKWERDQETLAQLETQWVALEPEYRQAFEQRFVDEKERFAQKLREHREAVAAKERADAPVRAHKEELIARVQTALDESTADDQGYEAQCSALKSVLSETVSRWQQSARLSSADGDALETRFLASKRAAEDRLRDLELAAALARLCARADALISSRRPVAEREVKAIERGAPVEQASESNSSSALRQRLEQKVGELRERLRAQAKQKEKWLDNLPGDLDELESAVQNGELSRAVPLHDRIDSTLKNLAAAGIPHKRTRAWKERLARIRPALREMRTWRHWGADRARERLCDELEALTESPVEAPELAERIRAARAQWDRLSKDEPATDRDLRRRFEAAAKKAYEPCRAYFEQQSKAREANLAKRATICEELEAFIQASDWSAMDWKSAVSLRRKITRDWRHASPVDRRHHKASEQRLRAALEAFDKHLDKERKRNLGARERLIAQVIALKDAPEPKEAAAECAKLQKLWATTVPGSRRDEQAIWERFRAACDDVFGRRQEAYNEQQDQWQANLKAKEALCADVEALLNTTAQDLDASRRKLQEAQATWQQVGPVAKRSEAAIEKRLTNALHQFEKRTQRLSEEVRWERLEHLTRCASLCDEAEGLLSNGQCDANTVAALRARWSALRGGPERDADAVGARFERACEAALSEGEARAELLQACTRNGEARAGLCLKMEVLAGVESPPEHREARMALQVQRLSDSFGHAQTPSDDQFEELVRAWCAAPPGPLAEAQTLEQRFQAASATYRARS